MKELSILSASVLVLGLGGAPLTFADDTPNTCSVATLRGTYAFSGVEPILAFLTRPVAGKPTMAQATSSTINCGRRVGPHTPIRAPAPTP